MYNVDYRIDCTGCRQTLIVEHFHLPKNGQPFKCDPCSTKGGEERITHCTECGQPDTTGPIDPRVRKYRCCDCIAD